MLKTGKFSDKKEMYSMVNKVKKGLIELKRAEIEKVQGQLEEQTNLMDELWKTHNQFKAEGESLKAIEAKGKYDHIQNTVIPQIQYQLAELERELGWVNMRTREYKGLLGEERNLKQRHESLEKHLANTKQEIEAEKRRFAERMERFEKEIIETNGEMEQISERLGALLGG